jgi:nucleoside-diphosphate-sugar epimerase
MTSPLEATSGVQAGHAVATSNPARATIAVTGATGFIARRLLNRLIGDGRPAVALSRRGSGLAGLRHDVVADYADVAALARAFEGVDAVIHLAARAHSPTRTVDDAELFQQANVHVTRCLAQAAVASGVRRFVLVSSMGVHGNRSAGRPFSAGDRPRPAEPYAVSKWQAEQALVEALAGHATDFVVLRPPLVYGPGCPGNFDKLLRLVARAPVVPFGALHESRSFIYLDNLVDALLIAADHPAVRGGTYLLADGRDVAVADIVRRLAAVLRPGRHVVIDVPPRLLRILAQLAGRRLLYDKLTAPLRVDAQPFREATGWRPRFEPEQGIDETARQFRDAARPTPQRAAGSP